MESFEGLRALLDELNAMIGEGTVEIDGIFGDDEREESIDWLAPGGAVVINNATGEMHCFSPKPPRYFTAWDGSRVPLAERHDFLDNYVLDCRGKPRPTNDCYAAHRLLMDGKARTVARSRFRFRGYNIDISTVFLVFDHAYFGGPPVLWETMIFTGQPDLNEQQWRYRSRKEAEKGHRAAILMARRCIHALTKHGGRKVKAMLRADGYVGGIYESL